MLSSKVINILNVLTNLDFPFFMFMFYILKSLGLEEIRLHRTLNKGTKNKFPCNFKINNAKDGA